MRRSKIAGIMRFPRADISDSWDTNAAIVPAGEDESSRDDLYQALQISNQNFRDYLEENEDDTFEELTNENILMDGK